MLDTPHRRHTLRVAPVRTATPRPVRRAAAPKRAPLREALSGTAVAATLLGLVVAPLTIFAIAGASLALLVVGLGAPGLGALLGSLYQRRIGAARSAWAARQLEAVAVGCVGVAVVYAMGGMGAVYVLLESPGSLPGVLASTLAGTAYAMLLAVSALGASLELRRAGAGAPVSR